MRCLIAVLDDEPVYAETIRRMLVEGLRRKEMACAVDVFSSGAALLEKGLAYDAYLLDIALPGESGIAVGMALRRLGVSAPVVFVSAVESQVFDSFKVQPLDFIRKKHLHADFPPMLERLAAQLAAIDASRILLRAGGQDLAVRTREILYVESADKRQLVHLPQRTLEVKHNMRYFEERLPRPEFVRIHRCYVVNCLCISSVVPWEVTLDNGERLPVSRRSLEEVQTVFRRLMCHD